MFRRPNATVTRSNSASANGSRIASASTQSIARPTLAALTSPRSSIGRQKSLATIRTAGPALAA
jgi:hypothetical protein